MESLWVRLALTVYNRLDSTPAAPCAPVFAMPATDTKLLNHYADHNLATEQSCSRCLHAFKEGEIRFILEHGCIMPDREEGDGEDLCQPMFNEGHVRCFRCKIHKSDCLQVSFGQLGQV